MYIFWLYFDYNIIYFHTFPGKGWNEYTICTQYNTTLYMYII